MKIHEYQAKNILNKHGVPVPNGEVANTSVEAVEIAEKLGGKAVVKAQVHAGGRGKAGGVKLVDSSKEAGEISNSLLNSNLVTIQTGTEGVPVDKVLIEEIIDVQKELYVAFTIDGVKKNVVAIVSEFGGMEIEEVAETNPDKVLTLEIESSLGVSPYKARKLASFLNVDKKQIRSVANVISSLYDVFVSNDCSLVEINPLVITSDDRVLAADAKITIDEDSLFRHPDLSEFYDPAQEDPFEKQAAKFGISYVKLDGDIGCLVNGAGLAMATMDVTRFSGASPANFLDVGGGADEAKVSEALKIILLDEKVKKIFINIFGGILKCDIVARGILDASKNVNREFPELVVRMLGTNFDEGREILLQSGLNISLVHDLKEAADLLKSS
ncbi:MAG: ADP-forming succinate--CoA ligase subunit beta [SAR202 cluster bacterium]|nr:ADP-forming succinate--CoA ligase subunit beta [SAR202 cluster bacterium]